MARRNTASEQVEQRVHFVDRKRKRELLSFLIGRDQWRQVLVFTRTKHGANHLAEQLGKDGITAAAIHGNKSQGARTRALDDFKNGRVRVLVATDIAARGLDIDQLPYVVNYELPNVAEDYVHRIGRTGRAGCEGLALSLVCVDEHKLLRDIERLLKKEIPREALDGFAPIHPLKPSRLPMAVSAMIAVMAIRAAMVVVKAAMAVTVAIADKVHVPRLTVRQSAAAKAVHVVRVTRMPAVTTAPVLAKVAARTVAAKTVPHARHVSVRRVVSRNSCIAE